LPAYFIFVVQIEETMFRLTIISLFFIGLSACAQERTMTIAELFDSPDCSGQCYQTMPCEGEELTISIFLTGTNVMRNGDYQLYIRDPDDIYKTIQVQLDETVSQELIQKVKDEFDRTVYIRGIVSGYDLLSNEFCKRAHILTVQSSDDMWLE
jgi:hypothetical protein